MTGGVRPRTTTAERRARLGVRHLLAPARRAAATEDVADALVALHATDPATVFLSAGARLARPDAADVERALYEDVTLVRLLSMRRTMFAVTAGLAPVVEVSTARAVAARERATLLKHLREGGDGLDERWLADAEAATLAALAARGEATGTELSSDVPALRTRITVFPGKKYEAVQGVATRVLRCLATDGHIRRSRPRGGWTSSRFRWTAATPPAGIAVPDDLTPARAKAELARRWLAAYGPATEADLAWWTGWTLRDVRAAIAALAVEETDLDDGTTGLVPAGDSAPTTDPGPWAALLPGLDPTAMGWRDRGWFLAEEHRPPLFDGSGNIGPTVWWNGEVVGGWAQRADGEIVWRLLADRGDEAEAAVAAEAERLAAWTGAARVTPRFRTPLERALVA